MWFWAGTAHYDNVAVRIASDGGVKIGGLGTVIDYFAGVPSARAVKAAGHLGAVRCVSERRAAPPAGPSTWPSMTTPRSASSIP